MTADWVILHGGALGDLVLTIQLALRLPGVFESGRLRLISRSDPGDLSTCRPRITRQSAEGLELHWLHTRDDRPAPQTLRTAIRAARVLNTLAHDRSIVHRRLRALGPAALLSFDPRPRAGLRRHITQQWQTDLEVQGLLIPKCMHQQPMHRTLGVSDELRTRGQEVLRSAGSEPGCVLIHAGSGGRDKSWALSNFISVARLLDKRGRRVCFLVGPVELEWWSKPELAAIRQEFATLHAPTPADLAAALAAAGVLIANDSGPAHLAALLGTPTVAVFGPTTPTVWRPLGRDVHVVAGNPRLHPDDWGITPEQVVSLATVRVELRRSRVIGGARPFTMGGAGA